MAQTKIIVASTGFETTLPGDAWTLAQIISNFTDTVPGIANLQASDERNPAGDRVITFRPRTGTKGSEQDLAILANADFAAALGQAGGSALNVVNLVKEASDKAKKELIENLVAEVTPVVTAAQAKIQDKLVNKAKLLTQIEALDKEVAETQQALKYFNATQNAFPLRKNIGLPTSKNILAQFPDIDTVPADWTAPGSAS